MLCTHPPRKQKKSNQCKNSNQHTTPTNNSTLDKYFGYEKTKSTPDKQISIHPNKITPTPSDNTNVATPLDTQTHNHKDWMSESDNKQHLTPSAERIDIMPQSEVARDDSNDDRKLQANQSSPEWTKVTRQKQKQIDKVRPSKKNKAVDLRLEHARTYIWRYNIVLKIEANKNPPIEI